MIPTDRHGKTVTTATQLEALPLPTHIRNGLHADGIYVVEEVLNMTDSELLFIPNMGRKSINQLRQILETYAPINTPPQAAPAAPEEPKKEKLPIIQFDEELLKLLLREILREHDIVKVLREHIRKKLRSTLHKVLTLLD